MDRTIRANLSLPASVFTAELAARKYVKRLFTPSRMRIDGIQAGGGSCRRQKSGVRMNQRKLTTELNSHYDLIVSGSCSSRSVVARRLAEDQS